MNLLILYEHNQIELENNFTYEVIKLTKVSCFSVLYKVMS